MVIRLRVWVARVIFPGTKHPPLAVMIPGVSSDEACDLSYKVHSGTKPEFVQYYW